MHEDLVGSSLYRESEEGTGVNGVPLEVPAVTLDRLVEQTQAQPPFLIKVDVQGAELDVLAGAQTTLRHAELILLEVSFFQFFEGAPLFCEVLAHMSLRDLFLTTCSGYSTGPSTAPCHRWTLSL